MVLIEPDLPASKVLHAFLHDAPYLFMGAAFVTVGLVSIAICALRKRYDALLVWLAVFAGLYGIRLWMQSKMLDIEADSSEVFRRVRSAIDFVLPLPALLFLHVAGFGHKDGKLRTRPFAVVFALLATATLVIGTRTYFYEINTAVVMIALWILLVRSFRAASKGKDFAVVRIGVLTFVALALLDNMLEKYLPAKIEPYGFAIMLGCFGYVAARRTLQRDLELGEIQKELELARRIQLSILPGAFPRSADFSVAARYVPMSTVAGDLYDYFAVGDRKIGLFIADVSGHGVPAALIASMVKMAAVSQQLNASHPAQLLTGMNAALCGNSQDQFVTAAYAYLDAESSQLRYAAAGHPAMLLLRAGTVSEIAENGLILAASAGAAYSEITLPLVPGDRLLLYTDGLVEARNAEGKLLGDEAFMATFAATSGLSPEQAADRLIAAAQHWAKTQDDDLTVIVCDYFLAG